MFAIHFLPFTRGGHEMYVCRNPGRQDAASRQKTLFNSLFPTSASHYLERPWRGESGVLGEQARMYVR